MSNRRRWIAWLLTGGAGTAVLVWALAPRPVMVDAVAAGRGPLTGTVPADGVTRVRDRYVIAAPITGRLARIERHPGDPVARGEVLLSLEPAPLDPRTRQEAVARLEAALDAERTTRATLSKAQSTRDQLERELARVGSLYERGVVAAEARERAELAAVSARQEHEAASYQAQAAAHAVEQARAVLGRVNGRAGRIEVRSPAAGRLLRLYETSERVVAAGTPVAEVGDPTRLEVVADLLSTDAVKVTEGDTMYVVGWGGPDTLLAIVRRVEPSGFTKVSALGVEEQRVNVVGDLLAPPPSLGDRFRVEVRVVIWRLNGAMRVPRTALFRLDGGWQLFVVEGGRARRRAVRVGLQSGLEAEIAEGLQDGDLVIVRPDDRIDDGTRVDVRSD